MQTRDVIPNYVTLRTAIKAADRWGREGDRNGKQAAAEALIRVLRWVSFSTTEHPTTSEATRTWNLALRTFVRLATRPELDHVFDIMCNQNGPDATVRVPQANVWSYNTYLSSLKRVKDVYAAVVLWGHMLRRGVNPDVVTYNSLLDSAIGADLSLFQGSQERNEYGGAGVRFVNAVLNSMERRGIGANVWTETMVMRVLSAAMDKGMDAGLIWERFLAVLKRETDTGEHKLDKIYFDSVITAFGKAGDLDGMYMAFRAMHERDIRLDARTVHALLIGAKGLRDPTLARQILRVCRERGLQLDHTTYTTAISVCGAGIERRLELVEEMLQDALDSGLHWNESMINAAIASYGSLSAQAVSFWKRLRECEDGQSRQVVSHRVVYDALMRVCGRDARADVALRILYAAKNAGHVRVNSAESRVLFSAFRKGVREAGREKDIGGVWMGTFVRHLKTECGFSDRDEGWDLPIEKIRIRF